MDHKITAMLPLKLIGFQKEFGYETAHSGIPEFWDEIFKKYMSGVDSEKEPSSPFKKAVADNCIGEFGVCIDDIGGGRFRYLIAGRYTGGEIPEGMTVYEFPRGDWAVFDCIGPIPKTLQDLNTRIFREWLPNDPDYELRGNANVEWYDLKGMSTDPDYHSAIWIPVKKRGT
jgi:AraC family transcriptional regulator